MDIKEYYVSLIIFLTFLNINGFCLQNESENDSIKYIYEDYQEDSLFYKNDKGQLIEKQNDQLANGLFFKTIFSKTNESIENIGVETGNYSNGYKTGQCIISNFIYQNQLFNISHYKESKLNGDYYIFNLDGSLKYHTNFVLGSGYYKNYYIVNSSLKEKGELENGEKNGKWYYYDINENLIRTEEYISGEIVNSKFFNQRNNNSKTIEAHLRNFLIRSKTNPDVVYNTTNIELRKNSHISDSETYIYNKNGKSLFCILHLKKYDLKYTIKGLIEGTFVDGYKYGEWIYYHKNFYENIVKIEHYDSGVLNGHFYVLDTSGTMLYQTEFKNGTGIYKDFYPESGQLMVSGQYENGERTGDWTFYLESGEVCQIQTFENNKLIKKTMGSCPQYIMDPFLYHTKKGNNITDISLPPPPPQQEIKEVEPFYPDSWTP